MILNHADGELDAHRTNAGGRETVSKSCSRSVGWPSYENRLVAILALAGGVAALDAQAVFYLMPFIAGEFLLTSGQVGLIGSAVLIGWAVGGIIVARASDRMGKRKSFLIAAFSCFAVLSGLSALTTGFFSLLAARLLIGIAEGPVIPVKQAMVIAESRPDRRGLNMGIVQNCGAQLLGSLVGPILLVAIAQSNGWRTAFLAAGIPGIVVALLIRRFLREPVSQPPSPETRTQNTLGLGVLLRNRNLLLCALVSLVSVAWFFILLTFLPLYLVRDLNVSPSNMSLILSLVGLAGVSSSVIVPYLSDRIGRRPAICLFSAVGAIAPIGLLVADANIWLVAISLLVGCQMLGIFPLVMATVPQESARPEDRATATSLVIAVAQIGGGAAGPVAAGWLAQQSGNAMAIVLSGALAIVAMVLAPFIRETRPAQLIGSTR